VFTPSQRNDVTRRAAPLELENGTVPNIPDHLNRPIRMTSTSKGTAWQVVWLPWGGAQQFVVANQPMDLRFPGQWFQPEAGLHYNWHRHYDPSTGRYTQPDPLGFVDGPSVYGNYSGRYHLSPQRSGATRHGVQLG
jgi:RHS repeat-associated protein